MAAFHLLKACVTGVDTEVSESHIFQCVCVCARAHAVLVLNFFVLLVLCDFFFKSKGGGNVGRET